MRLQRPTPHRSGGFTLIEILVAVLITSLLFVGVTQILRTARIRRDQVHNMQETQLAGPMIMDRIEDDLRGIFILNRHPADYLRIKNRVLSGIDADSIDFATSVNSLTFTEGRNRPLWSDYNEVGYRLRINPENDDFLELYRREGFGIDDEPFDGGQYTFLTDRVHFFDIQVFEEDGPEAEPIEDWGAGDNEETFGLPARIEIELQLEMAPRLVKEQLLLGAESRRVVAYRRIVRFPQSLQLAREVEVVPLVPEITPPTEQVDAGGLTDPNGGGGVGDGGSNDNPFGGDDGGGGLDVLNGGGGERGGR